MDALIVCGHPEPLREALTFPNTFEVEVNAYYRLFAAVSGMGHLRRG